MTVIASTVYGEDDDDQGDDYGRYRKFTIYGGVHDDELWGGGGGGGYVNDTIMAAGAKIGSMAVMATISFSRGVGSSIRW